MKLLDLILIKEVVYPFLIILISFLVYIIIRVFTKRLFNIRVKKVDIKKKKTVYNLVVNLEKAFIIIVAFLMILNVYGVDTVALVTSLGIVGVVAGLAVQDTLKDFISGISIIFENKFCVGDNITVGDFRGDVIDLGMKTTKVKSLTGEVLIVPNHLIDKVINHSVDKSVAIVDVGIPYEENLEKVERVLEDLCKRLTKELDNLKGEVQLQGVNELGSSSIIYRIVADTIPVEHYDIQRKIRKELKLTLDKNNINIPYEQVVVHNEK